MAPYLARWGTERRGIAPDAAAAWADDLVPVFLGLGQGYILQSALLPDFDADHYFARGGEAARRRRMKRRAARPRTRAPAPAAGGGCAGWLEEAGWQTETATLLGHGGRTPAPSYSLGGTVSTVIAADDPGWTGRLVLLDPVWYVPVEELAVRRTFADPDRWDVRDTASRIPAPTLVLGGDPAVYTMLEPAGLS